MRVINWDELICGGWEPPGKTAMTIGVFDGVHRGHRELIGKIVRKSPEYVPAVVTFKDNPKKITRPASFEGDILSLNQKLDLFAGMGTVLVIVIDFSGDFSKLGGRDFMGLLAARGKLGFLSIGENFHCGYRHKADAEEVRKIGAACKIRVEVMPPVLEDSEPVSSSRIRAAVKTGALAAAAALLGRNFEADLSGLPLSSREGGTVFNIGENSPGRAGFSEGSRVMPPAGSYGVLVHGGEFREVIRTEALIKGGALFIPLQCTTADGVRIEFII
ncbi:hypothetical protein FACS189468_0760 [Spirochaetia bacterium]|nr:hypothetical protein FACS189468_0760 [Spirochaetia bacterium]